MFITISFLSTKEQLLIKHKNNRKYEFVAFFMVLETNYALIKDKPFKGFIKYLKEPPILA